MRAAIGSLSSEENTMSDKHRCELEVLIDRCHNNPIMTSTLNVEGLILAQKDERKTVTNQLNVLLDTIELENNFHRFAAGLGKFSIRKKF